MADILKILVETGNSVRNVDQLTTSVEEFEKAINKPTKGRGGSLSKESQKNLTSSIDVFKRAIEDVRKLQKDPRTQPFEVAKEEAKAFQNYFHGMLGALGKLSAQELQWFKDRGVNLGGVFDGYLKDLDNYVSNETKLFNRLYAERKRQGQKFSDDDLRALQDVGRVKLRRDDRIQLKAADDAIADQKKAAKEEAQRVKNLHKSERDSYAAFYAQALNDKKKFKVGELQILQDRFKVDIGLREKHRVKLREAAIKEKIAAGEYKAPTESAQESAQRLVAKMGGGIDLAEAEEAFARVEAAALAANQKTLAYKKEKAAKEEEEKLKNLHKSKTDSYKEFYANALAAGKKFNVEELQILKERFKVDIKDEAHRVERRKAALKEMTSQGTYLGDTQTAQKRAQSLVAKMGGGIDLAEAEKAFARVEAAALAANQKTIDAKKKKDAKEAETELKTRHLKSIRTTQDFYNATLEDLGKFSADELNLLQKHYKLKLHEDHAYAVQRRNLLLKEQIASGTYVAPTETSQERAQKLVAKIGGGVRLPAAERFFSDADADALAAVAKRDQMPENLKKTTSETQALAKANKSLSEAFRQAGFEGNNLHSVSRGLASSFGLLWLTWGNLAPLFAGAAISSTVKNVVVLGAEIQHTMETIRVLSNESQDAVNGLNTQLLELARTGPYGPKEIAAAMKSLSLAGLNASEVTYAIKDVLNFAVAGTTDLKTAQTTLTSVASAFGIASDGYNYVGDVITKAAAVSQTSVEGMAAAFRSAASVHVQYGASLEDLAVGFAALSSVGIDFSSAGTMLRNFYADLSGRSPKVSKALKELNIDMRQQRDEAGNLTGKFVDLVQMFEIYQKGVERLSGPGQTEAFKTIFGERGGKLSAAGQLMSQMAAKEKENVDSGISRLREIQKSIQEESAGFMIQAATQLALTPQSQLKSIGASLQATFVEAFKDLEPQIAVFSKTLKDMFKSEEFKGSVEWLAETAMSFAVALTKVTKTVVENIGVFGTLIGLYYTARVGLAAYSALVAFKTIRQNADTAATVANTGATIANTAAQSANNVTKLGGLSAIAKVIPGVGGVVTLAAGAWALYEMWANRGALANANFADNAKAETVIENLRQEADRLDKVNKAREQGITLQEYELKLKMQQGKQEAASSLEVARKRVQDARQVLDAGKARLKQTPGNWSLQTKVKSAEDVLKNAQQAEYKAIQQAQDMDDAIADLIAKAEKDAAARRRLKPQTFGTDQFNADGTPKDGGGGYAGFGPARFSPLESIIKRERMRGSELQASMEGSNKATLESKKAFTELEETYEQAFNSTKNLSAAQLERLQTSQKLSAEELKSTGLSEAQIAIEVERTKNAKGLTSEEYKALGISEKLTAEKIKKLNLNRLEVRQLLEDNAAIQKNIELRDKQVQGMQAGYRSSLELAQARSKAAKDEADAAALKAEDIKYQDSIRSLPSTLLMPARDIEIAKNKIRLDAEAAKKKAEADTYTMLGNLPENDPEFHVKMVQEFELLADEKKRIDQAAARDTSTAISEIYKEKWKAASQSMADDFASSIMNKSFTLKDFLRNQFNNLILKPQLQLMAQGGFDAIGTLLKGGLNILAGYAGAGAVGGTRGPDNIDVGGGWNPAAGTTDYSLSTQGVKLGGNFEGGGYTGNGPRAGGLDGRGGFMAMVHPDETIIDHTRGQSGSGPVYVTINNTVGDVATKSMLDQANANTVKQIQAGIYRSSKYNGAMAR